MPRPSLRERQNLSGSPKGYRGSENNETERETGWEQCVCVCVGEREGEREGRGREIEREREREKARERERERKREGD